MANLLLGTASFALLFHYSVYPQDLNESRRLPGEFGRGDEIALPHCSDTAGGCEAWAASGECDRRPNFMYQSCPKACGGCSKRYEHSPPHRVDLRPGVSMPAVGFGTAGLGDGTARAVVEALNVGYRKIDGAQAREWYREDLIGQALQLSSVRREDIFLTTKVHPRDFGAQATMRAVQRSLGDLGTEYLDLVLLHYSKCWGDICGGTVAKGTWQQRSADPMFAMTPVA